MPQPKRNLFLTKTAVACYLSFCATATLIAPKVEAILIRGKTETEKLNIRDSFAIAVGVIGAVGTLIGRYDAGGTYTPKYLPGDDPLPPLQ